MNNRYDPESVLHTATKNRDPVERLFDILIILFPYLWLIFCVVTTLGFIYLITGRVTTFDVSISVGGWVLGYYTGLILSRSKKEK